MAKIFILELLGPLGPGMIRIFRATISSARKRYDSINRSGRPAFFRTEKNPSNLIRLKPA